MKKVLLAAVVILMSQFSFAAGMAKEKLDARIDRFTEIVKKAKEKFSGDFRADAEAKKLLTRVFDSIVKNSEAGNTESFMKLVSASSDNGKAIMTEIGRLSSIVVDKTAKPEEVKKAKAALDLLALSSNSVEMLSRDEAHAKEQQEKIALAIKVSERIAAFEDFSSQKAKDYVKSYRAALESGSAPRQAMKIASTKINKIGAEEITEEKIESCDL